MNLAELVSTDFIINDQHAALDITGLTADSRNVEPGFLFAALPGTRLDGVRFIPNAVQNGAVAFLIAQGAEHNLQDFCVLEASNPRKSLAHLAARFYQKQPEVNVAVTGTNGKTSVASFVQQIWTCLGKKAASLGTTGLMISGETVTKTLTTPEPVVLHQMLKELTEKNVTHLALEASSHGLQQHRLDGVHLQAAAFTNISQDHLDYHRNFDDYFSQKLRLFSEVLPKDGRAVVNMDDVGGQQVADIARSKGIRLLTVGKTGQNIHLAELVKEDFGQRLQVIYENQEFTITLPLVGTFQASNALVAAGLCLACGAEPNSVFKALEHLQGAKGRLEYIGKTTDDAAIFIDYAHTPDALKNVLQALRPYVGKDDSRLIVVFGCGGDRDKGKRPLMGQIAQDNADLIYVTDDNPRSENPAQIRAEIMLGASSDVVSSQLLEIGDRQEAIETAIAKAKFGDIVVIAGKGHETGQIVGDQILPFSDHEAVHLVLT